MATSCGRGRPAELSQRCWGRGGAPKGTGHLEQEWGGGGCREAEACHQPAASLSPRNLVLLLARTCWQEPGSAQGANTLLISQGLARHLLPQPCFAEHAWGSVGRTSICPAVGQVGGQVRQPGTASEGPSAAHLGLPVRAPTFRRMPEMKMISLKTIF